MSDGQDFQTALLNSPAIPVQLPLDLGHRPALDRNAFLVTPANAEAVAWIDRWPDWPAPALVLEGPAKSGKTHLASVWQKRAQARLLLGEALRMSAIPNLLQDTAKPMLAIRRAERADERALLHLYNAVAEAGGQILLISDLPPARWGIQLRDLASRLKALPVASIQAPDDRLMQALLGKLFADRQLSVGAEIIDFMVSRMERSFAEAERLVTAIDGTALARHRRITIPLVRAILLGAENADQ